MARHVCFYFQAHQPYRIRDMRYGDIGEGYSYFDDTLNRAVFHKVSEKCYLPANRTIHAMLRDNPDFRVAYSLSGVFLDQCREYGPDVLRSFQELAETGQVEFLAETYYHSLASIGSLPEFCEQVTAHVRAIHTLFGQTPRILRNTELIFQNEIAQTARAMGFEGILTEGVDRHLHGHTPNVPHRPPQFDLPSAAMETIRALRPFASESAAMSILLKNYRLSDDVAFRFSDRSWSCYPLQSDTYARWIAEAPGECVNLFMDYETFGEHQWEDTGIFQFLRALPQALRREGVTARTPGEIVREWNARPDAPVYDVHHPISWADTERDLSAWLGNTIQEAAFGGIYALEAAVKRTNDPSVIEQWRRLLTSDHLYYMCTKHWADGDVHTYFSPYDSPYEAYRRFSHALHDLRLRLS